MIGINTPTIETKRCILRKFTLHDADDFYELMRSEKVNQFLPCFPITSKKEAEEFIATHTLPVYQKPSGYMYAISLKESNKVIGYIKVSTGKNHDLGYAINDNYWHQGYASEVGLAVLSQVCKDGFDFITATHDIHNPNSGKVMKKLGMEYKYSYHELWQPKNFMVTFRMYQLNFTKSDFTYLEYWNKYEHFVESNE